MTCKITAADGEVSAKVEQFHRFLIHLKVTVNMALNLSASDSRKDCQLDRIFFESWYGHRHDGLWRDRGLDMFHCLSVYRPTWPIPPWRFAEWRFRRSKTAAMLTLSLPPGCHFPVALATGTA